MRGCTGGCWRSFDLLSLDLMFLAFRYQPGFGPLAVA